MKLIGQGAARLDPRTVFRGCAIACALVLCAAAQAAPRPAVPLAASSTNLSGQGGFRGIFNLDGPWRFQIGDDARWADPGFDDSFWTAVWLDKPLVEQGVESYTGYAWYRLHLEPQQLSAIASLSSKAPLQLLVSGDSVGQLAVYINGSEAGHTRGLEGRPEEYLSPPVSMQLSGSGAGGWVLAIRTWAGPTSTIRRGLLDRVELGTPDEIAGQIGLAREHRWNDQVIAPLVVTFLFLCVALLGAALYLSQRHHAEYLWMALLCLSVASEGGADVLLCLGKIPVPAYGLAILFAGHIFMAVTLEFVLLFTASKLRKLVRTVQISVLAMPILSLARLERTYDLLSVAAEVVFCALVTVLLFQAWRRGRKEAGVMLVPFFLAATADSADTVLNFAAGNHWIPEQFGLHRFHLGPVAFSTGTLAYSIFLGSLIAVILYRFVRVNEDEQRSAAEIAAARSVQSLLIPTHLPSNRHFMLESAYLPVNGVGGDFFQVLPLQDNSLLIVVGDVSGKGLQAAMSSSTLVGALRNELSHDPGTILHHLNQVLLGSASPAGAIPELETPPGFATCLCARVYPDGQVKIANAGHLSPYRDGREMELEPNLPLGVIAKTSYPETTFSLNPGDRLVFLSDGVVEATNAEGELFGFERTQQVSHESARYIAQTAKHFGQTDDITVVSLYFASRAADRAGAPESPRPLMA